MTHSSLATIDLIGRMTQISTDLWSEHARRHSSTITESQALVLSAIHESEAAPTQTDLVEATGIDRSTLADIVRRMEKHKHLTRKRDKVDARAIRVTLTESGKRSAALAHKIAAAVSKDLKNRISGLRGLEIVSTAAPVTAKKAA